MLVVFDATVLCGALRKPIGRALPAQVSLHNRPIGEIVYELTGRTREDMVDGLPRQLRLIAGEFDVYDIHLVAAAAVARAPT